MKRRRSWSPADPHYIGSYAAAKRKQIFPVLCEFDTLRHVALTVDRSQQPDPAKAYEELQKSVSDLFKMLRRNGTLPDNRYVWFLEFHKDGFPHLHLLFCSEQNITSVIQKHHTLGRVFEKRFKTIYQHLGYVTKQLTRSNVENLPAWFSRLPTTKARRYRTSHGFYGAPTKRKQGAVAATRKSRPTKTVAQKQAELAADPRGDLWIEVPRRGKKPWKLNCATITERSELVRLFGTDVITMDLLATVRPSTPAECQIYDAVYHAFGRAYNIGPRGNLSVIAHAAALLRQLERDVADEAAAAVDQAS
ncbi:hypothetical protein [Rosistilla oblonga]|uniref:rolling circle replication-associated protein n=1 Tax=Rosistilla oblonga TaxID=2527990 RepID=UPI003A973E73